MLQMTSQAAATLNRAREKEGLPETYGVRIFANPGPEQNSTQRAAYGFGFVDGPEDGDEVGETEVISYYVAPEVAPTLDGVVLDVADSGNLVLTRSA
ncbi:MAG TPA: iron-sulfur cluster biosynthesis family protein [Acidimicrobiia bacterium]